MSCLYSFLLFFLCCERGVIKLIGIVSYVPQRLLQRLEEVILFFDGDEAGREGKEISCKTSRPAERYHDQPGKRAGKRRREQPGKVARKEIFSHLLT